MKQKRMLLACLLFLVLMPGTLWLGVLLPGRWHYLTSTLMVLYTLIWFFSIFESRRVQARELVTLAVLCALAVMARTVFIMFPHFKPITAIVMIAGAALGAQAGFLVGAVSAFASNFIFGQGPWTPWQMLAYGTAGFLAGILYQKRLFPTKKGQFEIAFSIFGFLAVVLLVGPMLDTSSVFTMLTQLTPAAVAAIYISGIPVNLVHGFSTLITLLLFSRFLLEKLNRLKTKYGMMEEINGI